MNVFVTVGLERKPFVRLVRLVDIAVTAGLLPEDTLFQYGHTDVKPMGCRSVDFLSYDEMVRTIDGCDLVITHAGVGTVLLCLDLGLKPLVVPRLAKRGEHVDNHQQEFADRMLEQDMVYVARNEHEFLDVLRSSKRVGRLENGRMEPVLVGTVRDLIGEVEKRKRKDRG